MEEQTLPTVSQILIYPVKSLDGIAVDQATVSVSGGLKGDREFALINAEGQFLNDKPRNPASLGGAIPLQSLLLVGGEYPSPGRLRQLFYPNWGCCSGRGMSHNQ